MCRGTHTYTTIPQNLLPCERHGATPLRSNSAFLRLMACPSTPHTSSTSPTNSPLEDDSLRLLLSAAASAPPPPPRQPPPPPPSPPPAGTSETDEPVFLSEWWYSSGGGAQREGLPVHACSCEAAPFRARAAEWRVQGEGSPYVSLAPEEPCLARGGHTPLQLGRVGTRGWSSVSEECVWAPRSSRRIRAIDLG